MSVVGEFERYALTVLSSLRESDVTRWHRLAAEVERDLESVHGDVAARARVMLDSHWLHEDLAARWPIRAREALDSVQAISRIILGRTLADNS